MTHAAPRRTLTIALLLALSSVLLVVPATAHHGTTGATSVTAADRTSLELVAEAYMLDAHNDQRATGQTRDGVTYTDVGRVGAVKGWTDVTTVARRWADKLSFDTFKHNPDYSSQYGYWRGAGENIAITTIQAASKGTPTSSQVRSAAEKLMRNWWDSEGHRRNWMNGAWDHVGVGAAVQKMDVRGVPHWVLVGVANFRDWNGRSIGGATGFAADGSTPPNEGTHGTRTTTSTGVRFSDVPKSHTFHANIDALATSGVTKGCGGSSFCPDEYVTRGQMAAFLTRALDLPAGRSPFRDTRGHTFEADAAALAASGITRGCSSTEFCPDQRVTRGQMAAFLTRALDLPAGSLTFLDTRGHLFGADVAALARAGITKGCSSTEFCPDRYVTRAQMAAFLDRAGVLD